MKKRFLVFFTVFTLTLATFMSFSLTSFCTNALSKQGSVGDEVTKIQTKLSEYGYYDGKIDGIFGSETKNAVMLFQQHRGLKADGIVGDMTLAELGIKAENSTTNFTEAEVSLLARFISAEARGESYEGQVAVGAVILNRVDHPSFPNTISGVLYQPGAFECLLNGQIGANVADSAKKAAVDAMNGWDPTGGAIYYYNPKKTSNKFMLSREVITTIGDHRFCS